MRVYRTTALAFSASFFLTASSAYAQCNQLLSELMKQAMQPAVADIGCLAATDYKIPPFGPTVRVGIDKKHHHIESLCYVPGDTTSTLHTTVQLRCRTSDAALIKASISEKVHAELTVRNSDCQIVDHKVTTSGEIGKIVAGVADFLDLVRPPLQKALNKQCQ